MRRARAALLLTLACLVAAPAAAQPARPAPAKAKKSVASRKAETRKRTDKPQAEAAQNAGPQAPPPDAPRPYDGQIARLAEAMGALAFLRDICKAGDGDDWRDKMTALLDAEAPSGVRRERLIGAFNRGFRGFELTYRSCTPNAEVAIARYLAEADRITGDIAAHFGEQ